MFVHLLDEPFRLAIESAVKFAWIVLFLLCAGACGIAAWTAYLFDWRNACGAAIFVGCLFLWEASLRAYQLIRS